MTKKVGRPKIPEGDRMLMTTVYIKEQMKADIDAYCEKYGSSMAKVIRTAVKKFLAEMM